MAEKDKQSAVNWAEITSLQNRVYSLTADAKGYCDIRHRFINVYCWDVRKDNTKEVRARIKRGDGKVHKGNMIIDAQLYTTG